MRVPVSCLLPALGSGKLIFFFFFAVFMEDRGVLYIF